MPLVDSPRLTDEDRRNWQRWERVDRMRVKVWRDQLRRKAARALADIEAFAAQGTCFVGVSWGKDSMALAHIVVAADLPLPLVWMRVRPVENPDTATVRNAFMAQWTPWEYHEIEEWCSRVDGRWIPDRVPKAAKEADRRWGRRITGVRGDESTIRKIRMGRHGVSTRNTCAPIGNWSTAEVFAYLYMYGLPIHPVYAMTQGDMWDRERLRVASLGGEGGKWSGREQWERHYYRREMQTLDAGGEL